MITLVLSIRVARVCEDAGPDDGQRVLVGRIWPRGFSKDDPRVGKWCKVAASSSLVTATREVDGSHAAVLARLLKSR